MRYYIAMASSHSHWQFDWLIGYLGKPTSAVHPHWTATRCQTTLIDTTRPEDRPQPSGHTYGTVLACWCSSCLNATLSLMQCSSMIRMQQNMLNWCCGTYSSTVSLGQLAHLTYMVLASPDWISLIFPKWYTALIRYMKVDVHSLHIIMLMHQTCAAPLISIFKCLYGCTGEHSTTD